MLSIRAQAANLIYDLPEAQLLDIINYIKELQKGNENPDTGKRKKTIDFSKFRMEKEHNFPMDAQSYVRELRDNDRV